MDGLGRMRREQTGFSDVMETDLSGISEPFQETTCLPRRWEVQPAGGSPHPATARGRGLNAKLGTNLTAI